MQRRRLGYRLVMPANEAHKSSHLTETKRRKREGRMRSYLVRTRPAFWRALERAKELGSTADGVLAGPTKSS